LYRVNKLLIRQNRCVLFPSVEIFNCWHDASLSLRRLAPVVHAPIVAILSKTSSVRLTQTTLFFLGRIPLRVSADPDLLIPPIAYACDHFCDHFSP
jgi:hypothetical protein